MPDLEIVEGELLSWLSPQLSKPTGRVWLAAPFFTDPIGEWLATQAACVADGDKRLLLAWTPDSLAAGYLSARAVKLLQEHGFVVESLHALHAKFIVIGDKRPIAYVGSGNLTTYGLGGVNYEVGVIAKAHDAAALAATFEKLWQKGTRLRRSELSAWLEQQQKRPRLHTERQPGFDAAGDSGAAARLRKARQLLQRTSTVGPGERTSRDPSKPSTRTAQTAARPGAITRATRFTLQSKNGVYGEGDLLPGGRFRVKAGALINGSATPYILRGAEQDRQELFAEGKTGPLRDGVRELFESREFRSLNRAADVLLGTRSHGKARWKASPR